MSEHDHRPQRIDLHLHWPAGEKAIREGFLLLAERIAGLPQQLTRMEQKMAQIDDDLTTLSAQVARVSTVVDSAVTAIAGIQAMINNAVQEALAAGATPAELQAITDASAAIGAKADELAAAIATMPGAEPQPEA